MRRAVFDEVGGYPRALGKLRGTLLSGEDHQLCERTRAAGYRAVYEPSLVVRHLVPADRLTLRYFVRWFFWSGVTHAALDGEREGGARRRLRRYHARQSVLETGKVALAAASGAWPTAVEALTRLAFSAGYVWSSTRRPGAGGAPARRQPEAA